MCRRGSNHILTMDTQEGRKVGAGLRRLAWPSAKGSHWQSVVSPPTMAGVMIQAAWLRWHGEGEATTGGVGRCSSVVTVLPSKPVS